MIADLGVIIAAGGCSRRYGGRDKLLELLGGLPVFLHSVRSFLPLVAPGSLVVAVRAEALAEYRALADRFMPGNTVRWVPGGETRVDSVCGALDALEMSSGLVAIHDAARPLASAALLEKVAARARICGGAIAASRVTDSLKLSDGSGMIVAPVPRDMVYHAETPQVFDLVSYRAACRALGGEVPSDDAEIMRLAGFPVELVISDRLNIKLTSPEDLEKLRQCFPEC